MLVDTAMCATATTGEEVRQLREEVAVLRAQIAWLKQQLFGPGKSETLDRAQLLLQLGELEKLATATHPTEIITYERASGPAPKRTLPAESFAHLPVKETVIIEPEAVKAEPSLYERIGEECTFEVDVIPPQLFKRQIVRPKYRHRLDRNRAPLLAPAPKRVVNGGFASAGLIAWALTAKFCDHLPLFRQEKMLARWGAPISRQNLSDWVGAATALLEPLVKQMKRELLQSGYVQADETPIRCNDPDLRDGKTTTGWLWALSRPGGDVIFEWRLSRRHEEAERLLGEYRGVLHSDGYEGYAAYARAHPHVEWAGCWAHARRRFIEAAAERPRTAERVLRLIGELYALEAQWDEQQVGDRRAALRQEHFARPLARLRRLVVALQKRVLPRSGLGQACTYLLGQWTPLTTHVRHSQTKLDTNAVENAIRPSKLGAKNWLFVGHPDAGDRAAVIYSLVVSCQRHGHDPHAYLRDVLTRLPAMTTADDLRPLLPAHWRTAASPS
ncbi:MAG: IS66 family transposase [Opitutus sp.]|nr:IS66 family transposase [Opitutus sp.]MCR6654661.1 IS66 family transposase [Opitutus sp.]MCR6655219.1 IS66 family transposase [Opitutus sp.]